jgi:hypothetical protein
VVFPGFTWHNRHPKSPPAEIPRLKGRFLWKQYVALEGAGAATAYQAMLDELEEGTAVFKCANDPPGGKSRFVTFEGLPADPYPWLTAVAELLRGELAATADPPARKKGK